MGCFTDYLGLKGITASPVSGLFINDLPGINFEKSDAVADTDYATGIEFINAKITHAIGLVTDDLRHFLAPYFKLHSQIDHQLTAEYKTGYHAVSAANRGLKLEKTSSTLTKLFVNRVKVLSNTPGANVITITDGGIATNYTVTLAAGVEQWVEINYIANRDIIFITMDNTALAMSKGKVKKSSCSNCGKRYQTFRVWGWNGTRTKSEHYGLRADVSVICSDDDLACVLKERIKYPVLYKFGVEFMKEVQETDRLNYFTLVGREQAGELQQSFEEDYVKRFESMAKTLPRLLRSIDLNCVTCTSAKYIEVV